MQSIPLKSRLIKPHDDLIAVILQALKRHRHRLQNGDVLAVVSKALSYAEGRLVDLNKVKINLDKKCDLFSDRGISAKRANALTQLMLEEADMVFNHHSGLTFKNLSFIPAAGIDLSNAPDDMAILWPKNPFESARRLLDQLKTHFKLKKLGILIVDSSCQPLRAGTTGRAIGWAGFEGVEDVRGTKDLYGKKMHLTQKAVADNLASATLLEVGESDQRTPFVIHRDAPVRFSDKKYSEKDAFFPPDKCLFRELYSDEFLKQFGA